MRIEKQILLILYLCGISVSALANETYICNITGAIEAKFDKGKWVQTRVFNSGGVYRVSIKGKSAEIVEQSEEKDSLKTACNLVGGTIGYKCEPVTKIVPFGERFVINYFHELNELTISSEISMREMSDYSKEVMKKRKYFDGIRFEVKEQYGKCVEYQ
jgi:hypothetical protein